MKKTGKKIVTVQEVFEVWFEEYVDVNTRTNTQKSYRGMIEKHIFPHLGKMEMSKLNARILQKFINERKKHLKRSSLSKLLAIMLDHVGPGSLIAILDMAALAGAGAPAMCGCPVIQRSWERWYMFFRLRMW